jgi:hypothetical protein
MNFTLNATNPVAWVAASPTPGGAFATRTRQRRRRPAYGWEETYSFTLGLNDANDDADSAGLSNLEEFLAETNPRDPADRLSLELVSATVFGSNLNVQLGFLVRSNKTYTVVYRSA